MWYAKNSHHFLSISSSYKFTQINEKLIFYLQNKFKNIFLNRLNLLMTGNTGVIFLISQSQFFKNEAIICALLQILSCKATLFEAKSKKKPCGLGKAFIF